MCYWAVFPAQLVKQQFSLTDLHCRSQASEPWLPWFNTHPRPQTSVAVLTALPHGYFSKTLAWLSRNVLWKYAAGCVLCILCGVCNFVRGWDHEGHGFRRLKWNNKLTPENGLLSSLATWWYWSIFWHPRGNHTATACPTALVRLRPGLALESWAGKLISLDLYFLVYKIGKMVFVAKAGFGRLKWAKESEEMLLRQQWKFVEGWVFLELLEKREGERGRKEEAGESGATSASYKVQGCLAHVRSILK